MPPRASSQLLFDIAQACRAIQEFNAQGSLADYAADSMRRAATERMFEIIGEAMTRLRSLDNDTLEGISERAAIIGFRNRLIHGYDLVDDEIVWKIVEKRCQFCRARCKRSSRRER